MTTILADANLGVICSDSAVSDEDRIWSVRKVHRIRGNLATAAGKIIEMQMFFDWLRDDMVDPPDFAFNESTGLVLRDDGLFIFDESCTGLTKVPRGIEAIGSGGKGAICAYEALGWKDPARAVRIGTKHDPGSRAPIRTYRLRRTA